METLIEYKKYQDEKRNKNQNSVNSAIVRYKDERNEWISSFDEDDHELMFYNVKNGYSRFTLWSDDGRKLVAFDTLGTVYTYKYARSEGNYTISEIVRGTMDSLLDVKAIDIKLFGHQTRWASDCAEELASKVNWKGVAFAATPDLLVFLFTSSRIKVGKPDGAIINAEIDGVPVRFQTLSSPNYPNDTFGRVNFMLLADEFGNVETLKVNLGDINSVYR